MILVDGRGGTLRPHGRWLPRTRGRAFRRLRGRPHAHRSSRKRRRRIRPLFRSHNVGCRLCAADWYCALTSLRHCVGGNGRVGRRALGSCLRQNANLLVKFCHVLWRGYLQVVLYFLLGELEEVLTTNLVGDKGGYYGLTEALASKPMTNVRRLPCLSMGGEYARGRRRGGRRTGRLRLGPLARAALNAAIFDPCDDASDIPRVLDFNVIPQLLVGELKNVQSRNLVSLELRDRRRTYTESRQPHQDLPTVPPRRVALPRRPRHRRRGNRVDRRRGRSGT
mmetsp:Transcript_30310/g.84711  ORF Transcript_30310/g.84711 Transcript_30310/m.84711 type:complete len:280 (-) Transcript_30310:277-1116(-)